MPAGQAHPSPLDVTGILASSNVGVWIRDPERDVVYCDALTSRLFGLGEAEGAAGVTLERLFGAVHPEDRMIHHREVHRAKVRYGAIAFEYRLMDPAGAVRRVLVCGSYEPPESGRALNAGRGVVIDVTESRVGEPARLPVRADDPADDQAEGGPLDRAAYHALAAVREIERLGPQHEGMLAALRLLMFLLARELAKVVPRWRVEG